MNRHLSTVLTAAVLLTGVAGLMHATRAPAAVQARHVNGLIDAAHARAIAQTGDASLEFAHLAWALSHDTQSWQLDPHRQQARTTTPQGCLTLALVLDAGYVSAEPRLTPAPCA